MHNRQRFEGNSLEDLLAKAQRELDNDAVIVAANRLRSGGIAGFFTKERFEIIVESSSAPRVRKDDVAERRSSSETDPDPHLLAPRSLLDLAEQVSDGERARGMEPPVTAEESPFTSVLTRIADDIGLDLDDLDLRSHPRPPDPPGLTYAKVPVPPLPETPTSPVIAMLTDLGLPRTLVTATCRDAPGADDTTLATSLFNAMQRLPHPPALPHFAGAIVVVVGERQDALELARAMAIDLCLDPEEVVLASPSYRGRGIPVGRRITETGTARELGNRWRHQGRTRVVAVESSMSPAEALWASHLLGALQPTAVWAIANANQKNEDVVAWTERLGGIDALALTHLEDTVSPAALLRTGIPIARLDHRPATAALWTALLTERLAA